MQFSYGEGSYAEGDKVYKGQIILSEHKLFIKGPKGDLAQTYIPVEKIIKIKKVFGGMGVYVRPSLTIYYKAFLKGRHQLMGSLVDDIVKRRGFKKRFLKKEWDETTT